MSFKSWLTKVGEDFKKGLDFLLTNPVAVAGEEVAANMLGVGPLFNTTKVAIALAEQNLSAVGKQTGTGLQKSAAVVGIAGNLIKQGLADAGMANDDVAVQKWIDSVVTVLKTAPAA
jgi:hypothetical protein